MLYYFSVFSDAEQEHVRILTIHAQGCHFEIYAGIGYTVICFVFNVLKFVCILLVQMILRANTLEVKQTWVRKLREVLQETYLSNALPLSLAKSPAKTPKQNRASRYKYVFVVVVVCIYRDLFHIV